MRILSYFRADIYGTITNSPMVYDICHHLDSQLNSVGYSNHNFDLSLFFADAVKVIQRYFDEVEFINNEFLQDALVSLIWNLEETGKFNWADIVIELDWLVSSDLIENQNKYTK